MSLFTRQLRILIWKNLILKRRHYLSTLGEFLTPLLFCLVVGGDQGIIMKSKSSKALSFDIMYSFRSYLYSNTCDDDIYHWVPIYSILTGSR